MNFKIGDRVRCEGDAPGVYGRIIALTGNYATVHWNDGMTFTLFSPMLTKVG